MLLSHGDDDSARHEFEYARVIGIYHINVVYTGPGMLDYRARRLPFLWVRWYEILKDIPAQQGWENAQLDCLQFPPMSQADSFRFRGSRRRLARFPYHSIIFSWPSAHGGSGHIRMCQKFPRLATVRRVNR